MTDAVIRNVETAPSLAAKQAVPRHLNNQTVISLPETGWQELSSTAALEWNERLLQTSAGLFQLPLWNEPFRQLAFTPRYLVYVAQGVACAYTCILTVGVPGFRVGLVQRGPVSLTPEPLAVAAWEALREWAKRAGYVFLRFTHSAPEVLAQAAALGQTERRDAFPFYRDLRDELIVPLGTDEAQLLAGFQPVARRKIKRAAEAGYQLYQDDSPAALAKVWPLFERLAQRKGFSFRPLASFLALVKLASAHQCARLYVAALDEQPVEAILIVRDGTTAFYLIGALDSAALQNKPSPSCLLHWQAMQDCLRLGLQQYHLGTKSGKVYEFKRQFRPNETATPVPVTLVLKPWRYRLWTSIVLAYLPALWPRLKRLLSLLSGK